MKRTAPRISSAKPPPHAIVQGLALYRCPALCALITLARCLGYRRWTNPGPGPREPRVAGRQRRNQLWYRELEEIRGERRQACVGCPGVLALRRAELEATLPQRPRKEERGECRSN